MTALAITIFSGIIITGVATFLIFWTLDNVKNDGIRTGALIIYCISFLFIALGKNKNKKNSKRFHSFNTKILYNEKENES